MRIQKRCQSCGLLLRKKIKGTNADGSLSKHYCQYCFQEGEFLEDVTMEQMIAFTIYHMKVIAPEEFPDFDEKEETKRLYRELPTLKRWKGEPILESLGITKKAQMRNSSPE